MVTDVERERVLAVAFTVGGVFCLLAAARPLATDSPVALLMAMGVVGLAAGAGLAAIGPRLPAPATHAALVVLHLALGLLAWRSATGVGVVGLGPTLVCGAMYAAHFLPVRQAAAHLAVGLGAYAAGTLASGLPGVRGPVLLALCAAVLAGAVQSSLAAQLRRGARTDQLTGLANRHGWQELSHDAVTRATRRGPLTVAVIDLDDFKAVNDAGGHVAGDRLLRDLATAWTRQLRPGDRLARYGGDEFVLMLPGTDDDQARRVLDRLAAAHPASWSAGRATWQPGDTIDELVRRADVRLYAAKALRHDAPYSRAVGAPASPTSVA